MSHDAAHIRVQRLHERGTCADDSGCIMKREEGEGKGEKTGRRSNAKQRRQGERLGLSRVNLIGGVDWLLKAQGRAALICPSKMESASMGHCQLGRCSVGGHAVLAVKLSLQGLEGLICRWQGRRA